MAAFNQEKALVGAFSVIVKPMDRFTPLTRARGRGSGQTGRHWASLTGAELRPAAAATSWRSDSTRGSGSIFQPARRGPSSVSIDIFHWQINNKTMKIKPRKLGTKRPELWMKVYEGDSRAGPLGRAGWREGNCCHLEFEYAPWFYWPAAGHGAWRRVACLLCEFTMYHTNMKTGHWHQG